MTTHLEVLRLRQLERDSVCMFPSLRLALDVIDGVQH